MFTAYSSFKPLDEVSLNFHGFPFTVFFVDTDVVLGGELVLPEEICIEE